MISPESQDPITRLIESSSVWKSVSKGRKINLFLCSRGYSFHTLLQGVKPPWKLRKMEFCFIWPISFISVGHETFAVGHFVRPFKNLYFRSLKQFANKFAIRSSSTLCSPRNTPKQLIAVIDSVSKLSANLFLRILILKFLTCFTRLTN